MFNCIIPTSFSVSLVCSEWFMVLVSHHTVFCMWSNKLNSGLSGPERLLGLFIDFLNNIFAQFTTNGHYQETFGFEFDYCSTCLKLHVSAFLKLWKILYFWHNVGSGILFYDVSRSMSLYSQPVWHVSWSSRCNVLLTNISCLHSPTKIKLFTANLSFTDLVILESNWLNLYHLGS